MNATYEGSMLVRVSEELPLTNWLLMNSPVGSDIVFPFGAVKLISVSDIAERYHEDCTKVS